MKLIQFQRPILTPWDGINRLSELRSEIHRLFSGPFTELTDGAANGLSGWTPALDVFEDNDNFVVKAELPGLKKEEIDVALQDGNLTISGERKSETKHEDAEVYRAERYFGRFQRTVELPTRVAADKVKATYQDGLLTITVPKAEEAKPKRIDVSVN